MNGEELIYIDFKMPYSAKKLYEFIIQPTNMPLYPGCFLVPGILHVISGDLVRKVGTIDKIKNTDGSSHETVTDILIPDLRYALTLQNIVVKGIKGKLANPIVAFKEDWIFHSMSDKECRIERSLIILYKKSWMNKLFVRYFIKPQITRSLLQHHENVKRVL